MGIFTSPGHDAAARSEEHTSELQSQSNLVCRLLLEKKNVTETHSKRCLGHLFAEWRVGKVATQGRSRLVTDRQEIMNRRPVSSPHANMRRVRCAILAMRRVRMARMEVTVFHTMT